MKHFYSFLILISLSFCYTQAQVLAYPTDYRVKHYVADGDVNCLDLSKKERIIIGFQNDVSVKYYPTITDANNQTNELNQFYQPITDNHSIYARVSKTLDVTAYAVSEIQIFYTACIVIPSHPQGLTQCDTTTPPPPGLTDPFCGSAIIVCDINDDGQEVIDLYDYTPWFSINHFNEAYNLYCNASETDIYRAFYLNNIDATNETNEISNIYTLTGNSPELYYKIKNTATNQSLTYITREFCLKDCSDEDTDNDGVTDEKELDYDSDLDGITNRLDSDDDNDTILTINEDHNGNGDPTDDDIDGSGIPDYLEANITLSTTPRRQSTFRLYPNPTKSESVSIEFSNLKNEYDISLYDLNGKKILERYRLFASDYKLELKDIQSGLYFLKITTNSKSEIQKLIVN
ncbi:T9SS type A sorting domain-containing protein [Winogradskyella maritima]|uniref:T9SS type A sorting domain-containing protein n=1 Tax=Winogradskyella maritima TaxID=1517766 RepID=A0ABV8AFN0_9FLAO|nr:T9SS type A sorting domain-containing protein [Winogradskyella maritima]